MVEQNHVDVLRNLRDDLALAASSTPAEEEVLEQQHADVAALDHALAILERTDELEVAVAQAVEFAEYVTGAAKGKMVERAEHFLSVPYAQELAARLKEKQP